MVEISPLRQSAISHEDFLDKLEEMERNAFSDRSDQRNETMVEEEFGPEDDFDSIPQIRRNSPMTAHSSQTSNRNHKNSNSQRPKALESNFERNEIHGTDIELQY